MLQCDVCVKKDGWKGMLLQQCRKCGVCVHEDCYGVEDTKKKDKNWVCLACRAVGTDIEGWTLEGRKRKVMTVTERPVECVLCPVTGGVHAMHALYHYWGEIGRQAILPAYRKVPQRLAWVHTLCALSVCQYRKTRGTVYGCEENGNYEGDGCTAYFVMCGLNGYKEDEEDYMKTLKEHRELKCYVCGHHEKTAGRNLRVPLQCRAGDEDEFAEFKKHHKDEACTQAMHVGCAMWGVDGMRPQQPRQVWFFPGCGEDGEEYEDPVAEIFCECHAQEMGASMTGLKKSAVDKTLGTTVLQRTVSGPEDLELPSYANAKAVESLTKNPRMMTQMASKVAKEAPKIKGTDSSKTTKPSEGSSAAGATSSGKGTQKSPAPIATSIPRRASDAGTISKENKASDSATSSARAIQQTPAPFAPSIPRRASATDSTRTDNIATPSGGTAGAASLSTIPQKATPSPSTPMPTVPPSSTKQRENLIVPSHLPKTSAEHAAQTDEASVGYLSRFSQSQQVAQSSESLVGDTVHPASDEDEPANPEAAAEASSDLPTSKGSDSSKTTKPSGGSSTAGATSSEKVTEKSPAPVTAPILRRVSDAGMIFKGTKASDSATSSARAMQQTPTPFAPSVPRRASATAATRTDNIATPSGGTAGAASLSTIPQKATPSPSTPMPTVPPLSAKQRANLIVPSHLQKASPEHAAQTDEASVGYLSRFSRLQQVAQSSESLVGDTFHPASDKDEPANPEAATIASTNLPTSFDDSKATGRGKDYVPEDNRQQPRAKRRRGRSISEQKEDDANTPTKRRRRRSISEHKEDDANEAELDGSHSSQEDSVEDLAVDQDDGMWMDDDAYGLVKGEELNSVPPEGENPWAYLWKPGAPPFKMELIACAERRNVEGLVKSLYDDTRR